MIGTRATPTICFNGMVQYIVKQVPAHAYDVRLRSYHATVKQWMSLVEQEFPAHLSSPLVCNGVGVARSLVFCIVLSSSLFVLSPGL
jgi:hypothetical protein